MNEQLTNVAVANLRHHSAAFTERRERVRDRESSLQDTDRRFPRVLCNVGEDFVEIGVRVS